MSEEPQEQDLSKFDSAFLKEKYRKLIASEGYGSTNIGICLNEECDYTTCDIEPDATSNWCDICGTNTVCAWMHLVSEEDLFPESFNEEVELAKVSVKPGVYRHFKGNTYHVLGISENTETRELSVVYIPQSGDHKGKLANRSLAMFIENVDRPELNYKGPRFVLVEEKQFI